jgi:hypothetical protein
MKIAICIYGNISLWEYTKDSFKNILCNNIDADIFVSTYTQKQPSYTENVIINMFKDINLKGIIIEDRESILNTFNENILNNDILKIYEKHRQLYICNDIKKKYEHENNFKYDIVIETSFDVVYLNSPEWNLLLSNNIVLENHDCMEKSFLAGNNSVMDMIINDRNISYLVSSTYDHDILSNFCKINNIEIITLLDNKLIYIPSIGSKSIFDIENYELQDKIIKSLFSKKVKYISEDLILNTNDTTNIVLLTSMVYISNDHNKGVYTPEQRISQIIINCKNIREKIPNSIIILLEGSKLTNYDIFTLYKHVDHLILYFNVPNINYFLNHWNKSWGEVYKLIRIVVKLENYNFNKLFKITSRYSLNNNFNIENFSSEFISGKKSEDAFYTMLYCVPKIQIHEYKNILTSFLLVKQQHIDIEHHIYAQQNIQEIHLLGIDAIYACGDTYHL